MEFLNYESIKETIDNCYKNKIFIERIVNDLSLKQELLSKYISNSTYDNIENLKQIIIDDLIIFEYDVISINDNKKINNILIVKNNNSILKIEHYKNRNYNENIYSIYQNDNNRLSDKLSVKSYIIDDYEHLNITVLGKFPNITNEYFKKEYCIYIFNNKIKAIENNNNMYIENEVGFNNIVRTFKDLISKFYLKFNQKINFLNGDDVKEYHIVRKKQGQ